MDYPYTVAYESDTRLATGDRAAGFVVLTDALRYASQLAWAESDAVASGLQELRRQVRLVLRNQRWWAIETFTDEADMNEIRNEILTLER